MIVSELFEGVLLERRPDAISALAKYASDPDIYITFVDLPKVGINPQSTFNTPLGIYTYPLQAYWDTIRYGNIPFASERPYVYVLKSTGRVLELADYSKAAYEADLEKLHRLYGQIVIDRQHRASYSKNGEEFTDDQVWGHFIDRSVNGARVINTITNPFGFALWVVTMSIADTISKSRNRRGVAWNSILRSLGYTGISDKAGQGIIHPNEPTQAVFLTKQAVRVVELIDNIRKGGAVNHGKYPIKVHGLDELIDILFYDHDEEGHSEQYRLLMKEWPTLLLTGKSEHFEAINEHDFTESFFAKPEYSGMRAGLSAFINEVGSSHGAASHLIAIANKYPEAWPIVAKEIPEFIPYATLSRADMRALVSPEVIKAMADAGIETNVGELLIQWALKPVRMGYNRKMVSVQEVLSKLAPVAKNVLRLVPADRIQAIIDKTYDLDLPF